MHIDPATIILIWAGFESFGKVFSDELIKESTKPIRNAILLFLNKISGIEEKNRQEEFTKAINKAEDLFVKEVGIVAALRIFSLIKRIGNDVTNRENLSISLLYPNILQEKEFINHFKALGTEKEMVDKDIANLRLFIHYFRFCLSDTTFYKPLVDLSQSEEANDINRKIYSLLSTISNTNDININAIRVTLVDIHNYENERAVYLQQIRSFCEDLEFNGFPDLRENKSPVKLEKVYIPLKLNSALSYEEAQLLEDKNFQKDTQEKRIR